MHMCTIIQYLPGNGPYTSPLKYIIHQVMSPNHVSLLIFTLKKAKSQAANDEMMAEWLQRDPRNCWERLIQKLKDAGLKTAANNLKHALCNMIHPEND